MTESLDTLLRRTANPFLPLQVGGLTAGWVAPYTTPVKGILGEALVAVGDTVFPLDFSWLLIRSRRLNLDIPRDVQVAPSFEADLLLSVPTGSIDFIRDAEVDYNSDRTVHHLFAALVNFDTALKNDVQSRLNNLNLDEAITMYAGLLARAYPYSADLTWRGESAKAVLYAPLQRLREEILAASDEKRGR